MKSFITAAFAVLCLSTFADAEECKVPPQTHTKELEQLKSLEGKWEGTAGSGPKADKIEATFHVTAGGSAVVETLFPGSPHEMVSVYTDHGGKVSMTHYCMSGNQPKMDLTDAAPGELHFDLAKDSALEHEDHMHSLNIAFIDKDNIVENWSAVKDGKPVTEPTILKLRRSR